MLISATNLKAGTSPPLRSPITNGFPPFRSDFERQLSIESPAALAALVSCMAGPGFRDVVLFGTFCAQSRLVRQALVAFSAYTQGRRCGDSYKLSLRSYQFCVADMKQNRSYEGRDPAERDRVLTAIMFLGLLEVSSPPACTLYSALCTLHSALCTLHSALYALHSALCTLRDMSTDQQLLGPQDRGL